MIYTRLSRTGEIVDVKAHGGGDISEVYGGIGETNPIYYKSRTITGTLPLSYKALGKPLSDYLIEGNTVQDGTPTPDAPVDVVGCGEWDATEQQYKIPVVCGGVTSNIYLGNVHTTRRIKKLVLTGNETVNVYSGARIAFKIAVSGMLQSERHGYCTHFAYQYSPGQSTENGITFGDLLYFTFSDSEAATVGVIAQDTASFKSFLAQQYANGTPVTIWCVLANAETGIVNEPLHKIGSYTDTITMAQAGVTLPTTAGSNTLSVGTTVQPSSMSITGNIKEVLV